MEAQGDSARRRSYSILGLQPGASLPEIRRRYRFLAQRWHPDRHAGDARNLSEAGLEMRRVNEAYRVVVEGLAASATAGRPARSAAGRMSPEELDELARTIGSDGPVDWLLGKLGWVGSAVEGVLGVLVAIWLAVSVVRAFWRRDYTVFREHPEIVVLLVLLGILAARELSVRARLRRSVSPSRSHAAPPR